MKNYVLYSSITFEIIKIFSSIAEARTFAMINDLQNVKIMALSLFKSRFPESYLSYVNTPYDLSIGLKNNISEIFNELSKNDKDFQKLNRLLYKLELFSFYETSNKENIDIAKQWCEIDVIDKSFDYLYRNRNNNLTESNEQFEFINSFLQIKKDNVELSSNRRSLYHYLRRVFEIIIKTCFQLSNDKIGLICEDYNFELGFPVFKLIKYLIEEKTLFNEEEKTILKNFEILSIDRNNENIDEKLSDELKIECNKEIVKNITEKLSFINSYMYFEQNSYYGISFNFPVIKIDSEFARKINVIESTSFDKSFIALVLGNKVKQTHELFLGNHIEYIDFNSAILSENNYLINKEILDCFDFRKFLNKTRVLSSNVIIEMDSMLKQFFKFSKTLDTSKIKEVIKYFMIYELDYSYNELENSFESINREITLKECLINILSDVGAPVDANSLFAMCESQYPTIQCSVDIIRRICLKEPDFIYFGRSSVYGLSVWEKSKNLKGGTIRELVFEFLYNQKKPQSFYAITNYVNNFRKTNLRSVKSNIQLDNSGRFIVRNGYISLSDWEK